MITVALGQDPGGQRNAIDPKKNQICTALTQCHCYEPKLAYSRYRGIFLLSRKLKSLEKAVKEQLVGQSDECLIIQWRPRVLSLADRTENRRIRKYKNCE